jgi:hypothetical protein
MWLMQALPNNQQVSATVWRCPGSHSQRGDSQHYMPWPLFYGARAPLHWCPGLTALVGAVRTVRTRHVFSIVSARRAHTGQHPSELRMHSSTPRLHASAQTQHQSPWNVGSSNCVLSRCALLHLSISDHCAHVLCAGSLSHQHLCGCSGLYANLLLSRRSSR